MNTTTVNGITIPQGTTVQPDVWSLHYNSEHWGPTDPQQFDPDRLVVNKDIFPARIRYITDISKAITFLFRSFL